MTVVKTTRPEERPRTPQFIFPGINPACSSTQAVAIAGQGQDLARQASRTLSRIPACSKAHLPG